MNLEGIEIKAIKNERDYKRTLKVIDSLWDAKPKSKEADVLEVLSILVEGYEKINYPVESPDPIEYIKYLIDNTNLTKKELAKYLGGENRVSEVLARKRPLTLKMIKSLYHNLHIPADTLLAY